MVSAEAMRRWILEVLKVELLEFEGWTREIEGSPKVFVFSPFEKELPYPEKEKRQEEPLCGGKAGLCFGYQV